MIPDHRHGSVLWTLDAAIRRHLASIEDACSALNSDETARFLREVCEWLRKHLTRNRDPWRSDAIWQFDGRRKVPEGGEKKLAYELCELLPGLYAEVPAGSGVVDWNGQQNRHANVDLVREITPDDAYELIELKVAADTTEFAAAELVRNAMLYFIAKQVAPDVFCKARPILQATKISLRVWAEPALHSWQDWMFSHYFAS